MDGFTRNEVARLAQMADLAQLSAAADFLRAAWREAEDKVLARRVRRVRAQLIGVKWFSVDDVYLRGAFFTEYAWRPGWNEAQCLDPEYGLDRVEDPPLPEHDAPRAHTADVACGLNAHTALRHLSRDLDYIDADRPLLAGIVESSPGSDTLLLGTVYAWAAAWARIIALVPGVAEEREVDRESADRIAQMYGVPVISVEEARDMLEMQYPGLRELVERHDAETAFRVALAEEGER